MPLLAVRARGGGDGEGVSMAVVRHGYSAWLGDEVVFPVVVSLPWLKGLGQGSAQAPLCWWRPRLSRRRRLRAAMRVCSHQSLVATPW